MKLKLLPHQIEGKDFLIDKKRAMLCDTVGMGKTIQAIAALQEEDLTAIVFAPRSLRKQWYKEIRKFSDLKPQVIYGSAQLRKEQYRTGKDVYILNYEKSLVDQDYISRLDADCIILDEAQRIKNFRARRTIAIKEISNRLNPEFRWILTATPIQNTLSDLYSLLDFLNGDTLASVIDKVSPKRGGGWKGYHYMRPGIAGPYDRQKFMNAIRGMNQNDLYSALDQIMLRRISDRIPPSVKTYYLDMNADQKSLEKEFRNNFQALIKDDLFSVTNALALMTRLRQLSNTPQLINPRYTVMTPKLKEILAIAQDMVSFDEKVIFFSEFKKMTDIVSTMLTRYRIRHAYMHGETSCNPDSEKEKFIDNKDVHVMLATRTGEEGHNLQVAHHIVNIELPYNPSRIGQRIGRCDRIGQSHTVKVINLHSQSWIEERILDIIYEKEELFDDVINMHNKHIELDRKMIRQIATET